LITTNMLGLRVYLLENNGLHVIAVSNIIYT
jgi:hypothetical protein